MVSEKAHMGTNSYKGLIGSSLGICDLLTLNDQLKARIKIPKIVDSVVLCIYKFQFDSIKIEIKINKKEI